jgi:hypothetical protein
MEFDPLDGNGSGHPPGRGSAHAHSADEWNEAVVRTVAHLAAQLTVAQIRLRALASDLDERGLVEPGAGRVPGPRLGRAGGGARRCGRTWARRWPR